MTDTLPGRPLMLFESAESRARARRRRVWLVLHTIQHPVPKGDLAWQRALLLCRLPWFRCGCACRSWAAGGQPGDLCSSGRHGRQFCRQQFCSVGWTWAP